LAVTGQVRDSGGNLSTVNGHIYWNLSQAGNCTSGSFAVAAGTYVVGTLVNGVITGTLNIIGNDDITPSGTFWTYIVEGNDGNIIARQNVTALIANGSSQAINTLSIASLPFSAGTGVPSTRLISTTSPLSGGGDLSADRTLTVSTSPSSGSAVGTGRTLTATSPLTGGGDLSADRSFGIQQSTDTAAGYLSAADHKQIDQGQVLVSKKATGGNGSSGSPWTGWDTAITWAGGIDYKFDAGFYSLASSPAGWVVNDLRLKGAGSATTITFTGAGDGFSIVNSTYATIIRVLIEDLTIAGNAATTNLIRFKNCHYSYYRNLKPTTGAATALLIEGQVGGVLENFHVKKSDFSTVPSVAVQFDQSGASQPMTAMTITNIRVDGQSSIATGVYLKSATFNHFSGGYSENCSTRNWQLDATNTWGNTFSGVDSEGGGTDGWLISGFDNTIVGGQNTDLLHIPNNAFGNLIVGGLRTSVTVDAGALNNTWIGGSFNNTGAGAFTDNGTNTNVIGVRNQSVGDIDNQLGAVTVFANPFKGYKKIVQINDSTAINNTAAITFFDKTYTLPASTLRAGSVLRVHAAGIHSTTGTPTIDFYIRIGGSTNYICQVMQMTCGNGISNLPWIAQGEIIARSVGNPGTLMQGYGWASIVTAGTPTTSVKNNNIDMTALSINTTANQTVDVGIKWSSGSLSNTATMQTFYVEIDHPSATT
jgi:hypothetical protein